MKKLLIAIIVCSMFSCSDKAKSAPNTETSEITEQPAVSEIPETNWIYSSDVDKMTNLETKQAQLTANEELQFEFPYDGGSTATLTIIKKGAEKFVLLSVSKGQFITHINGGSIKVKFDNNAPITFGTVQPADYSSDAIFINSESKFIKKLKSANRVIIETEFFNEGTRQIEFDTKGFKF